MITLKSLLYRVGIEAVVGSTQATINEIQFDSRLVTKGDLFVALTGLELDGHSFIAQAINKGAIAVVCETMPEHSVENISYVVVENSHKALALMADNFYQNPSKHLNLIGITGTNGKTSVASMLYEVMSNLKYKCGLISTVAIQYGDVFHEATHTTPDAISIQKHLSEMLAKGITHCFMEVSSHGIAQNRVSGLHFNGGVFTNLTHDHLDYHGSFKNYRDIKKVFFDLLPPKAFALSNTDDKNGMYMMQNTKAKKIHYALKRAADYQAKILEQQFSGMLLKINNQELWTALVGNFNAYNLLAVFATTEQLGVDPLEALKQLSKLKSLVGRFQIFQTKEETTIIIDYAHTPDALENVLKTINAIRTRNEMLLTIVGCGGNRDKKKRPIMGKISTSYSDKSIFTSDNPRNESPELIIEEMLAGVPLEDQRKVLKITNRQEAIATAKHLCRPKDIILIAGKGHETYQEIEGVKHPFDDFKIAQDIFLNLN